MQSNANAHLEPHLRPSRKTDQDIPAQEEEAVGLPGARDDYKPYARRSNKPEFSLHVIRPDGVIAGFQYAHLDSNSSFTPEYVALKFLGMEPCKVLIYGRNLTALYQYIHEHRMHWIRELPKGRDFGGDKEPVITRVTIEKVTQAD